MDGLRDVFAVGSDVLDGRGADEAGDAGEALDAADAEVADVVDEGVPLDAGGDVEEVAAALDRAVDRDVQDEAGEAFIRDEEIAASAQKKER